MITNERELADAIDAWDPATGDLPDEVALALDESETLRARFDARFARWERPAEESAMPDTLEDRVMPTVPRRRPLWPWIVAGGLLAAAALLVIIPAGILVAVGSTAVLSLADHPTISPDAGMPMPAMHPVAVTPSPMSSADREHAANAAAERAHMEAGHDAAMRPMPSARPDMAVAAEPDPFQEVEPTATEGFVDHGVSGWKGTDRDPKSTFSIDVDRGSYTFTRRRLTDGFLPDPSSVRVEEFVNSLVYDYPEPDEGPFTVQFEASPSPWNDARHVVRIGVQGRHVTERAPVHLTFLVDTSGSMNGPDRLPLVKAALRMLVGELEDGDTVAIVTYAGSAGVALPTTPATDSARILEALDRLESGGSTAMGQGIELAYALADDTRRKGHTSRVIIASDGDANVGTTRTGTLSELIRGYADRGVTLTTLGFGQGNYQDDRLEQLANDGDGNYYYVDGVDEARRVFVDELTSTLEVIAKDVKIQVEWNPNAVSRYRLVGYENRALANEQFRDDTVDAGEIGAGHTVTALYVVELVPGAADPIATVRLRAKAPGPESPSTERRFTLPRGAIQPSFEAASRDHRMAFAMASFAERLRQSPYTAGISYGAIEKIARGAARADHRQDLELADLLRRAITLSGEAGCRELTIVTGGTKKVVLVDQNGAPCE